MLRLLERPTRIEIRALIGTIQSVEIVADSNREDVRGETLGDTKHAT
jgi:hypothetical protein